MVHVAVVVAGIIGSVPLLISAVGLVGAGEIADRGVVLDA